MNIRSILVGLLLACCLSSCATIFTGTRDDILIRSEPAGANIIMEGEVVGQTPALLGVRRTLGQRWVEIELEGYETERFTLAKQFNYVSLVNLFVGLAGWAIDLASGAIVKYREEVIDVNLVPTLPLPGASEGRNKESPRP